jgi:hypothetical protein
MPFAGRLGNFTDLGKIFMGSEITTVLISDELGGLEPSDEK